MLQISSFWLSDNTLHFLKIALEALDVVCEQDLRWILSVVTVSPQEIQEMNKTYRGRDGSTDILTFSFIAINDVWEMIVSHDHDIVGEIYLCQEKIQEYALERRVSYQQQMEMIIVHGLAHLLKYDHENDVDEIKMEVFEKKLSQEIKNHL